MELSTATPSSVPIMWTTSGLERIGISDPPGSSKRIQLYAARGEYEPFQIGIRSPQQELTTVNVAVSDLLGANQQVISKTNITLYREHYVYVSQASPKLSGSTNPSLGTGWYADGLIPFVDPITHQDLSGATLDAVPFNLDGDRNQPIWVDVFVPRNAAAGDYTGTFTITSDQGTTEGEIALKVWNFELPLKPSLDSSFSFWEEDSKDAMIELLKHKLMPASTLKPEYERELIDHWGLRSVRLPFWSEANVNTCRMQPAPSVQDIRAKAALHQPDVLRYAYSADEIDRCQGLHEPLKEWARNFHDAGIQNLVVMTPTPELYDNGAGTGRSAVDIWVVLPQSYDQAADQIAAVLQKGNQVWSYNALVQDRYSPKWEIDFAPINFRIQPGFISQQLGLTGLLYWRVDLWTSDPWNDQTYVQDNNHYPGEGMLVYPGQQVGVSGVAPSMRLKWLREGIEDYEYIEILKKRDRTDWALEISQPAGQDWKTWTRDPEVLEAVRRQLGEEIARLS
ncbi:DUF4091 domain-containing protein [Myxacorys almedinensis]|uniref:DUF4091 domain-containing protein n=1 Tax=Myxacorys almedinensis A TaxID=2690445 RepID=A0A8J8CLL9_9CYAN|nr:DUF4091 domain-containing protein [Myxacorys almedinensis]NDJ17885.1 DUF4091 domain-containing protein [Myxacorys almedinensis A]